MSMEDVTIWVDLLSNLSVIGLLALALWLGLSGAVIPTKLLDTVISKVVEDVLDELQRRGKL